MAMYSYGTLKRQEQTIIKMQNKKLGNFLIRFSFLSWIRNNIKKIYKIIYQLKKKNYKKKKARKILMLKQSKMNNTYNLTKRKNFISK
jgi:hypothetical protein